MSRPRAKGLDQTTSALAAYYGAARPRCAAHAVNRGVVLARVSDVQDQPVDVPKENLRCLGRYFLRKHYLTSLG
jgi:hypothetical protein